MDKAYDHNASEDGIYKSWEDSGKMRADNTTTKETFTIPIPPPNVTGQLHLGHAAMLAIEDIMIRYQKMNGKEVLWIPGTDHAAIATENVVLKHLGIANREEMGREEFLGECRTFAQEKHDRIVNQMKKMGAWLDWSREAYTFDDERNQGVNTIFKQLYDDGLIVRGHRMINWSVGAQSVIADDEVEWEENSGEFYDIQCGPFVIGTSRPETKCADSPVVINPAADYVKAEKKTDKSPLIVSKHKWDDGLELQNEFDLIEVVKGKKLEGMEFEYETYAGPRKFFVLVDECIDPKFGTGAMTISTSHSLEDYELAQRHDLPMLQKIDFQGKMTDIAGPCAGMTVAGARKESVKFMEEKGILIKRSPYTNRVPKCYRSNCVIEPMISPQWFVSVEKEFTDKWTGKKTTLKKLTQDAVREKHVDIIPARFEKTYFQWIDNLRDWCISRQIWWGHQIPVWYDEKGEIAAVGEAPADKKLKQDPDTLDTWFSSALWPFSTLGWPASAEASADKPNDYSTFYPTSVLETGHDIIFFWVARMIMFGRYATGKYPFNTVYLHGMVTDEHGKKMSKSKGNGIDPLEMIDEFGADAVRLSLVIGTSPGNPIPLGESKIGGYRNFVNKLWNAGRFVKLQTSNSETSNKNPEPKSLADKWILSRFSSVSKEIATHLQKHEISIAGDKIYHFVWDEFCDWYIEASKVEKNPTFLKKIFLEILKLTHPLCPFITEQLWKELSGEGFLVDQAFPVSEFEDKEAEKTFASIQNIVTEIRRVRADNKLNPKDKLSVSMGEELNNGLIEVLAGVKFEDVDKKKSAKIVVDAHEVFIQIPVDEKRQEAEKKKLQGQIVALQGRLANKGYVDKAPVKLINQTKNKLEDAQEKLKKLEIEN
jgi:valyl-tRNA synthetase